VGSDDPVRTVLDEETEMTAPRRYRLTKARLVHLLSELRAGSDGTASICVEPNSPGTSVRDTMEAVLDTKSVPADLQALAAESPTGAMVLWGPQHRYLIMPPFPIRETRSSRTCEIEPLYSLLHKDLLVALVLVRLGEYGIGVFKGEELVSSKVGGGLVHARHRQGGSSAHRFERHREKQMEAFFSRVCMHAREELQPHARDVDYLLYGGTRETILDFRRQCHYLHEFDGRTVDMLLNVRDPKQPGLAEAIREAWSSRVMEW